MSSLSSCTCSCTSLCAELRASTAQCCSDLRACPSQCSTETRSFCSEVSSCISSEGRECASLWPEVPKACLSVCFPNASTKYLDLRVMYDSLEHGPTINWTTPVSVERLREIHGLFVEAIDKLPKSFIYGGSCIADGFCFIPTLFINCVMIMMTTLAIADGAPSGIALTAVIDVIIGIADAILIYQYRGRNFSRELDHLSNVIHFAESSESGLRLPIGQWYVNYQKSLSRRVRIEVAPPTLRLAIASGQQDITLEIRSPSSNKPPSPLRGSSIASPTSPAVTSGSSGSDDTKGKGTFVSTHTDPDHDDKGGPRMGLGLGLGLGLPPPQPVTRRPSRAFTDTKSTGPVAGLLRLPSSAASITNTGSTLSSTNSSSSSGRPPSPKRDSTQSLASQASSSSGRPPSPKTPDSKGKKSTTAPRTPSPARLFPPSPTPASTAKKAQPERRMSTPSERRRPSPKGESRGFSPKRDAFVGISKTRSPSPTRPPAVPRTRAEVVSLGGINIDE